jgi:uncharacterized protein YecE (DUF72 family)
MPPSYLIGTSGWYYNHWRGNFYPQRLDKGHWLEYYSRHFNTVEINASFYRLPQEGTFINWRQTVPSGFYFSVKASRFITHIKRLKDAEKPLADLTENAKNLMPHLGPVLYQLPSNFHRDDARLESFLSLLDNQLKHVFEFRHSSWMHPEVLNILRNYKVAFCIFDMPGFASPLEITTNFAYIRFHGKGDLYSGSYPDSELSNWADKIRDLAKGLETTYIYFNNDAGGYAVQNARILRKYLEEK